MCWSVSQQAIRASRMTAAAGSASWSSGLPAGLTVLGAPRSAGAARRALTAAARGRCARRRRDRLPAGSAQMARISVAAPIRHTAVQARRSIEGTSPGSVLPMASVTSVSRSWMSRLLLLAFGFLARCRGVARSGELLGSMDLVLAVTVAGHGGVPPRRTPRLLPGTPHAGTPNTRECTRVAKTLVPAVSHGGAGAVLIRINGQTCTASCDCNSPHGTSRRLR